MRKQFWVLQLRHSHFVFKHDMWKIIDFSYWIILFKWWWSKGIEWSQSCVVPYKIYVKKAIFFLVVYGPLTTMTILIRNFPLVLQLMKASREKRVFRNMTHLILESHYNRDISHAVKENNTKADMQMFTQFPWRWIRYYLWSQEVTVRLSHQCQILNRKCAKAEFTKNMVNHICMKVDQT